jgi:zinc D-Ala-D-Ala dipeptidase
MRNDDVPSAALSSLVWKISLLLACMLFHSSSLADMPFATENEKSLAAASLRHDPLIEIQTAIPDVILDIRYATADNFLRQPVYPTPNAFLRRSSVEKLKKAAALLQAAGFRLKIFDGYRPLSVQQKMWDIVNNPRYVANPAKGSPHSRGGAIDLTLVTLDGQDVQMPSDYDDFSPKARHDHPDTPPLAKKHANLLRQTMIAAGFKPIASEWWHYHDPAHEKSAALDISFEELKRMQR